jgi:hypothetical protein
MAKTIPSLALLSSLSFLGLLGLAHPARANGEFSLEPNITFQDSTSFGIQGTVGITDNISLRPKIIFNTDKNTNIGVDIRPNGTEYGIAATYDFKTGPGMAPKVFIGPEISFWNGNTSISGFDISANSTIVSAIAGVEYPITPSFDLTGRLTLPLSSSGQTTLLGVSNSAEFQRNLGVSIGAAYRF